MASPVGFAASSLSLGRVADLPLDARSAFVRREGQADLDTAIRRLRDDAPAAHRAISVDRLAWAVAFNVTGEGLTEDGREYRGKRTYLDYWERDTPWADVWSALVTPLGTREDRRSRTGLGELAESVACEHRGDWQPPSGRPVAEDLAGAAFAALYDRHKEKVTGYVSSQFRHRAGDPADIAMEAWSRVFLDYWSSEARKRVLGTAAISSLICGTAYYVGCDVLRRLRTVATTDDPERLSPSPHPYGGAAPEPALDPGERLAASDLEQQVKKCREQLPTRQQLAARMVWDYELRQVEAARKLGISAPAVSQLLEKARKGMHKCLKSKGLVATHGPASPLRRSPGRPT